MAFTDNIGSYFGKVGKNEDSVFSPNDDFVTKGKTYNCFPSSLRISKAYRTYIHIIDERNNNSVTNVIAVCPQKLNFDFTNQWSTIEPFKMSGGSWVQAGIQTFGNGRTGFLGREISTIHYWAGGSPIRMSLTVQLYAEKYEDVEEKIFKPLKILANLAQPSTKPGSDALIAPGPAPFKFNLKYRGIKLKNVRDAKTGETKKEAEEDEKGISKLTDYQINAGKGVQTDIKIGDWFYLSDVLVDKVAIDIPMNLAKKYRNTTGSLIEKQSELTDQQKANADTQQKLKDLDDREKALATDLDKQNSILNKCTSDKNLIDGYRNTINDHNKKITELTNENAKISGELKYDKLELERCNRAVYEEYPKWLDKKMSKKEYQELTEGWAEAKNEQSKASMTIITKQNTINSNKASIRKHEVERDDVQKSLNTKLEEVGGDKGLAETKANAKKTKSNIETSQKQIPGQRQALNEQLSKGKTAVSNINKQLSKDSQAKPFMATIKLDIKTKYQTTQEDFNKMLSGIPNTKKLVDLDLRENGVISAATNLIISSIPGLEQNDIYGRRTEIVNQPQEDSNPPKNQSTSSKAGEAVKNANQKQENTESSSSWWNPTTWF